VACFLKKKIGFASEIYTISHFRLRVILILPVIASPGPVRIKTVLNSEHHIGARPSVRVCVGPELARCVHSNSNVCGHGPYGAKLRGEVLHKAGLGANRPRL